MISTFCPACAASGAGKAISPASRPSAPRTGLIILTSPWTDQRAGAASYPLAEPDRCATSETDCSGEQRIARCPLGSRGDCRVAMFDLFGPEFRNRFGKLGIAVAESVELLAVMAINLRLDRGGARHGRLGADQRSCCTQRKTRNVPDRAQHGCPDLALGNHRIEAGTMARLLRCHACDGAGRRMAFAHHRELPGIDTHRADLARLVDAQHRGAGLFAQRLHKRMTVR